MVIGTKKDRGEANLERITVPGDSGPGSDDILACFENVSTLDNKLKGRLLVFMPRNPSNDPTEFQLRKYEKEKIIIIIKTGTVGQPTRNCNPSMDRCCHSEG